MRLTAPRVAACLHRSLLPGRRDVRSIDCNEHHLVLFTRDAFFYQFELRPVYDAARTLVRIDTVLVHQVSMAGVANDPVRSSHCAPAAVLTAPVCSCSWH